MHFHFVSFLARTPWGGCEELWSHSALRLQRSGDTVSASVRWWPAGARHRRLAELQSAGVRLSYWAGRGSYYRRWAAQGVNRFASRLGLGQPIRDIDYQLQSADLVVFSSGGNEFPIEPIQRCRRRGQPYALIIHSVSEGTWPRDDQLDEMRSIYEGAVAAFFVSHANRASTVLQLGFDSEKFQVVSNPFNVAWDEPFTWPQTDTPQWAFVGRLEPAHKGLDLLLRAFARDRWRERDLRINLYGGGLCERSVKQMAVLLDLDARISFAGQVSDLRSIWRQNQLLLVPSRQEGLPLVVVEAMMFGRPCLVTNVSGNPELLTNGQTGFIAAGPTVDAVDAALETAWNQRSRLRSMGEAAHASIRRQIPRDPIGVFTEQLRGLAATAPQPSSPSTYPPIPQGSLSCPPQGG